jgi:hypothetical protein
MTTFTIIAYRPDHVDTCRGCVMDRTGSDFEISFHGSIEDAAAKAAEYESRDRNNLAYGSWEITLLVDGEDESKWWETRDWREEEVEHFESFGAVVAAAIKTEEEKLKAEKKRAEEAAREASRRRAELAVLEKETKEREQLRILLEKYPEAGQ